MSPGNFWIANGFSSPLSAMYSRFRNLVEIVEKSVEKGPDGRFSVEKYAEARILGGL